MLTDTGIAYVCLVQTAPLLFKEKFAAMKPPEEKGRNKAVSAFFHYALSATSMVSRAIISSSFVGTTNTCTLERELPISASFP